MDIGILSMQQVDNFGSLLQAYSLKNILESYGNNVSFIDIKRIDEDFALLENHSLDYSFEGEHSKGKSRICKVDKYVLNRLRNRQIEKRQNCIFEEFREKNLNIQGKKTRYDMCVIGSDEVFNCLNSGSWGFTSQLFGNVPEADKVITYAASCGATSYELLPEKIKDKIKKSFENISYCSVRDMNTFDFAKHFTNKMIAKNADPVIVWEFKDNLDNVVIPKCPKRMCLIYSYRNRINDKSEIENILTFCKEKNLTPVALGAPQFWINKYIACDPFQCLKLFSVADFVITDTFHGTIFSLKYAKRFATIIRESNKHKLSDLLKTFGAEEHLLLNMGQIEDVYDINKESEIANKIAVERDKAISYLEGAMETR